MQSTENKAGTINSHTTPKIEPKKAKRKATGAKTQSTYNPGYFSFHGFFLCSSVPTKGFFISSLGILVIFF
jgi:hypothetical protein